MSWILYHNPRCSKSREALALLRERSVELVVVEYLQSPPTTEALLEIIARLDGPAASLVRTKEPSYDGFSLDDEGAIARKLARHPELLERPLLVTPKVAVIGRPLEKIRALANDGGTSKDGN